jgi:tetratricopeptide (TPR) repeat protein
VAGVPVDEALAAIRPVVPVENEQYFKAFGINYLGTPEVLHAQGVTPELREKITFTLEKEGESFDITFAPVELDEYPLQYSLLPEDDTWIDARDNATTPLWLKHLDRIYYYEYLPESKTVYVRQSQIQDDSTQAIPAFYEEVFQFVEDHEVDRFVLDVRLNGGGNNYKNKPVVTGIIRSKIDQPGKLFVILGRRTYSACQNLVNELHSYTNAIFIGEPTSENINFYGDSRRVELPNSKLAPRLSYAWWQDKPQWENGPWLPPHLAVDMSFADYQNNVDPCMDAILNYAGDVTFLDPIAHLADLFNAGKIAEVQAEARRLVADPQYRYYQFESQFNRVGYNLLADKQYIPALYVFEMTTQLFPDSANAWDSLAEGHWRAGNRAKAIEFYEKAISLDPDGPTGDNARAMLAEIRAGGQ